MLYKVDTVSYYQVRGGIRKYMDTFPIRSDPNPHCIIQTYLNLRTYWRWKTPQTDILKVSQGYGTQTGYQPTDGLRAQRRATSPETGQQPTDDYQQPTDGLLYNSPSVGQQAIRVPGSLSLTEVWGGLFSPPEGITINVLNLA